MTENQFNRKLVEQIQAVRNLAEIGNRGENGRIRIEDRQKDEGRRGQNNEVPGQKLLRRRRIEGN